MPGVVEDLGGGVREFVQVEFSNKIALAETLRRCVRQAGQALEGETAFVLTKTVSRRI